MALNELVFFADTVRRIVFYTESQLTEILLYMLCSVEEASFPSLLVITGL